MKAVDFNVERTDSYLFIEFKDPQDPRAKAQARKEFSRNFKRGKLDEDFKYKYRDTFLYEWAAGRVEKTRGLLDSDCLRQPDSNRIGDQDS